MPPRKAKNPPQTETLGKLKKELQFDKMVVLGTRPNNQGTFDLYLAAQHTKTTELLEMLFAALDTVLETQRETSDDVRRKYH